MSDVSELRAKDLLRRDELEKRVPLCIRTIDRLLGRKWWRPCGNSARIWKKVGEPDPFLAPEDERPEHRGVYVAGRFVRIDQAEKAEKGAMQKVRDAAQNRPPNKPKAAAKPPAKTDKPDAVHTPLFGRKPENPLKQGKAAEVNRTPPIVPPSDGGPRVTSSGRFVTTPRTRTRPVVGGAPPGGEHRIVAHEADRPTGMFAPDARKSPSARAPAKPPPKQVSPASSATAPAPKQVPPASSATAPAPKQPTPQSSPTPPAPQQPAVETPAPRATAAPNPTPSATTVASRPAPVVPIDLPPPPPPPVEALNTMSAPQVVPLRRPTRVQAAEPEPAAAPKPDAPVNRAPPTGSGGGLDDLFGGGGETRVRMTRRKKPDGT